MNEEERAEKALANLKIRRNKKFKEWVKSFDTQGVKKLWNYFIEITETLEFKKMIQKLRDEFEIPPKGITTHHQSMPPTNWVYRSTEKEKILEKRLHNICQYYSLHPLFWTDNIKNLLFYNKLEPLIDYGVDLCIFTDLLEEKEDPFSEEMQQSDNYYFPLAIRISPYASQRDIIDFIKKNYNFAIKPTQKRYLENYYKKQVKIGKVKEKKNSIRERNNFILKTVLLEINLGHTKN